MTVDAQRDFIAREIERLAGEVAKQVMLKQKEIAALAGVSLPPVVLDAMRTGATAGAAGGFGRMADFLDVLQRASNLPGSS